jgi:ribosomal protein L11 methyltransferase
MTWWSIEVGLHGADPDAVAARLVAETGHPVEERVDRVVGFAPDADSAARASAAVVTAFGAGVDVRQASVADPDWTSRWREGIGVRQVGRLAVGPSWLLASGPAAVVVDPETAFGTGEHGSTRGALLLLDRYLRPGSLVLDLGCGSGILAIAAAKLGARAAFGIEVDEEAIPVAEANAARNGVADRIRFLAGDARDLGPLAGPADLIVSNILRGVNESLLEPIRDSLRPEGLAVFAGMEADEASLFRPALAGRRFQLIDEIIDEGWWAAAARLAG